jgi:DHA1 family inner membrane transport protein
VALSAGVSYAHLPLVGAVLALLAVSVAVVSHALERSAPVAVQAPAE